MKTVIVALLGALAGAGVVAGFYQLYPPGAAEAETLRQELADARFDRDTSLAAEARLRERLAELRNENAALAVAPPVPPPEPVADAEGDEGEESPMAEIMKTFGKAQSDLAFRTLVERMALGGEQLEEFKSVFDAMRKKRQEAYATMFNKGATLEHFAIIDGAMPDVDAWVAANLDEAAQEEYAAYRSEQEQNRIDRKANEELMWLGTIANLDAEQKDAAFEVFASHVAGEPPEALLEMSGPDEFSTYLDDVMGSRVEALTPILDEAQMEIYQQQAQAWRKMAEGMLGEAAAGD